MNEVTLLLGSNLGDKKNNIETAILHIEKIGHIKKRSSMLESLPEGYVSDNIFFNIGLNIHTKLSPISLLKQLKNVENLMGRVQDSSFSGLYEDRIIDIDIVYFNKLTFKSERLILPHERHIVERDFSKKILLQMNEN